MNRPRLLVMLLIAVAASTAHAQDHIFSEVWQYPTNGDALEVAITDVDGDGMGEIVVGAVYTSRIPYGKSATITVLDRAGTERWDYRIPGDLFHLEAATQTGVLLAGAQSMGYAISGQGGTVWKYFNTGADIITLVEADYTGEGAIEYLAGSSSGIRGSRLLRISPDGKPLGYFRLDHRDAPNRIVSADLDADGTKEIIVGAISGAANSLKQAFERLPQTSAGIYVYDRDDGMRWRVARDSATTYLAADDVDGDGEVEIIAGGQGWLVCLAPDGTVEWEQEITGFVNDGLLADLDGDGRRDVIVVADYVYALHGNGTQTWRSQRYVNIEAVAAADVAGDERPEVIAAYNKLRVLSPEGDVLDTIEGLGDLTDIAAGDLEGDGFADIAVASENDYVYVLESKTGAQASQADDYYRTAIDHFNDGNYSGATEYVDKALALYAALGDQQRQTQAIAFIERIENVREGNRLYQEAAESFNNGFFQVAADTSLDAHAVYDAADYDAGTASAARLYNTSATYLLAYGALEYAENYSQAGRYPEALTMASRAAEYFAAVGEAGHAARAQALAHAANTTITAKNIYEDARDFFADGDLVNARGRTLKARELFEQAGHQEGLNESADLLSRIDTMEGGGSVFSLPDISTTRILAVFVAGLLLVVGAGIVVIAVLVWRRRGGGAGGFGGIQYRKKKHRPKRKKHLSSLNP